jgi:hypothetical protein
LRHSGDDPAASANLVGRFSFAACWQEGHADWRTVNQCCDGATPSIRSIYLAHSSELHFSEAESARPVMQTAIGILTHTPIWVFPLLAFLIWQGWKSLQPATLPLWRMLIVPLVFFVMGLSRLVLTRDSGWQLLLAWFVAALLFASLALIRGTRLLAIDRKNGLVTRPGSPIPLIRNVTVFSLQYAIAVAAALHLDSHIAVAMIGRAISGGTAGYFAGRTVSLLRRYRNADPAGN